MRFERGSNRHLRLAVNEHQEQDKQNLAQTYIEILKKPDAVMNASLPDEVFSNVDDFVNHSTTYHNNSGTEKVAENISRYKDHDATSENIPTTTAENSNKRKISSSSYEIEYDPKNYDSIIYQDDTQNISNVPKRPRFNKLEMAIAPFKNIIMEICLLYAQLDLNQILDMQSISNK